MNDTIAVIGLRGFPDVQGGVEKHCEALYPCMTEFRFNVFRRSPYVKERAEGKYPNITFSDLPSTTISGFEALAHTFLAGFYLVVKRPKLVHVHNIGPGLVIPMLRLFGLKTVMTYHSANYEHKKWGRFSRAILRAGEWLSLHFADRVIFVNEMQMKRVAAAYARKVRYIPNGVVHHDPSPSTDFIESLNVKPMEYLLGVGRLTPEKGFEYLVRAVNMLDRDIRLVIAGGSDNDDTYYKQLRKLDTKGRVIFTGNVQGEQLRQLYSHAKLFVLSSVNEGFPLALLEAMDYRLPILASDIPGTRIHTLNPDDYFRPADTDSLRQALDRRLDILEANQRRDYDLSSFNWESIGRATAEVYREILD
ncbi:MAG: glycosyltransferase family 4 protein [Bacteroides sp.]|nr:glycosyltransferase family 4 protein [Bacteroides sp.]